MKQDPQQDRREDDPHPWENEFLNGKREQTFIKNGEQPPEEALHKAIISETTTNQFQQQLAALAIMLLLLLLFWQDEMTDLLDKSYAFGGPTLVPLILLSCYLVVVYKRIITMTDTPQQKLSLIYHAESIGGACGQLGLLGSIYPIMVNGLTGAEFTIDSMISAFSTTFIGGLIALVTYLIAALAERDMNQVRSDAGESHGL